MPARYFPLTLSLLCALACRSPHPPLPDGSFPADARVADLRSGATDSGAVPDAAPADAAISDGSGPAHDLDDSACTTEHPCTAGMCYAPGEFMGCGACRPPPTDTCVTDAACGPMGPNYICSTDPHDCFCSPVSICRPGCSGPADCDSAWQICGADHRCTGMPCAGPGSCPASYDCSAAHCVPRACVGSGDCPGGYCVKDVCYPVAGHCGFPPP